MKKKHIAILTTVVLAFSSAFFISSMPVFASGEESTEVSSNDSEDEDTSATNGDYDYTKDEEYTQSFYRSKSLFQSSYEYEEYCKQMYNMGYMDSDYEWTPAAQNFIR